MHHPNANPAPPSAPVAWSDGRDDLPFMVHSELDDIGLNPYEFRVYAHIVRRVGKDPRAGSYYESVANGAAHCRMGERSYRAALNRLVSIRLLKAVPRTGETTVYYLTPKREWRLEPMADVPGGPMAEVTGGRSATTGRSDRGPMADVPGGPMAEVPYKESPYEGSPTEGNPKRKRKPKKEKAKPASDFDAASLELPAFVDRQQWLDFVEHRKQRRAPVTKLAATRILKRLEAHPEHANQMLDDAIMNGWTGVFPRRESKPAPASSAARVPEHRKNPKRFRVNDSVYRPDTGQNEFIDELLEPMKAVMSNGEVWDLRGCERWTN